MSLRLPLPATVLTLSLVAHAGNSLCRLDDIDGDGVPEIAIASRLRDTPEFVAVVAGKDGKLLRRWTMSDSRSGLPADSIERGSSLVPLRQERTTALAVLVRQRLVRLDAQDGSHRAIATLRESSSLAWVRDVDGDGESDLLLGPSSLEGRATLRSSRDGRSLLSAPRDILASGPVRAHAFVEGNVCEFEDIDGDGIAEILVGAPESRASHWLAAIKPDRERASPAIDPPESGCVLLCSGSTGELLTSACSAGKYEQLGAVVVKLDDLDGDGLSEIAATAPSRYVRVLSFDAKSRTLKTLFDVPARTRGGRNDDFGATISPLADVDGDGTPEIVTGAHESVFGGHFFDLGYAEVWSGKTGEKLAMLFESRTDAVDVLGLPDIDGDQVPEVALSIIARAPEGQENRFHTLRVVSARDGRKVWEIDVAALAAAEPGAK